MRQVRLSMLDEWLAHEAPRLRNVRYNGYTAFLKQLFSIAVKDCIIPVLRKRYRGQHLWARGYFCATVDEETIERYIEEQKWDDGRGGAISHCDGRAAGLKSALEPKAFKRLPAASGLSVFPESTSFSW